MIGCAEMLAALGDYLEGEVGEELRQHIQDHLGHCRTCRLLYDSATKTLNIVTDSGSFELPQEISEPIVQKIMARVRACADAERRDPS